MEPATPAPDPVDLPAGLSLTRILRDTGRIWWRDLWPLTVLAAILELPIVLVDLAAEVTPTLGDLRDGSAVLTAGSLLVLVYGALSHHFLAGLLERVVASDRHGHQRATLGEVLTDAAFERMLPLGDRWADGVDEVLRAHAVPWHVTRLGARAEYHFMPAPPRTGAFALIFSVRTSS